MLKIGLLSTLVGTYQIPGEDGVRGAKLALLEHNYSAGGHKLELEIKSTNAIPGTAVDAFENLVQDGIKLIVGPLSGNEAIAIRDVAKKYPDCTIVNGTSGSQPIFNPADNFFMFNPTGAQLLAGLGSYCYETVGFRRIATIGEAYSFPFAQIGGFALDFVKSGGEISKYLWCALETTDYKQLIDQIPDDIDAIFSTLGGNDGLHFLAQFREMRSDLPLIGGSIFADSSLLASVQQYAEVLTGVVSSSTHADYIDSDAWRDFVASYRSAFPEEGFYSPSLFAFTYYVNTKALLLALDQVEGDLSQVQAALRTLKFETPIGSIHLDHHQVAVMDIIINEIHQNDDGQLGTKFVKRISQANCTFDMTDEEFKSVGNFGIDNMPGMKKLSLQEVLKERFAKSKVNN